VETPSAERVGRRGYRFPCLLGWQGFPADGRAGRTSDTAFSTWGDRPPGMGIMEPTREERP